MIFIMCEVKIQGMLQSLGNVENKKQQDFLKL